MAKKKAVIIGAGPAGLTAAYELLNQTDIIPVIYEATDEIGGISKTYNHNGNRMDMGGHRFFSKSEVVMNWWQDIMSLQGKPAIDDLLLGREKPLSESNNAPDPEKDDNVMLVRNRLSRIFYLRKFFDYPVSLNFNTLANLGFFRIIKIGFSYFKSRIFQIKVEKNLEDFMINRFGRELYLTFFKDYTEKVWGVPPSQIKPDWGAQRIKGISITKVLIHAIKKVFQVRDSSISQKDTETSLIEQFIYPKFGPGHLWEEVANQIVKKGGKIYFKKEAVAINHTGDAIDSIDVLDHSSGKKEKVSADFFISTMPIKDLVTGMSKNTPKDIVELGKGLVYRDFITVGLLLNKLEIKNKTKYKSLNDIVPDLWVYIQERDVKIGRLQIFNNWSPYLVKDPVNTVWLGLEYFANEGDELWSMKEKDFIDFSISELEKINIIKKEEVLDKCLVKVKKAYPAYFGTYDNFDQIKDFLNGFNNLFLIGRNGMHRYNNMDHSMLTAMEAVKNIKNGVNDKLNIWDINSDEEYHEEKK